MTTCFCLQSIPRIFSRYTVKEAKKSCNVPKNRYVDILPCESDENIWYCFGWRQNHSPDVWLVFLFHQFVPCDKACVFSFFTIMPSSVWGEGCFFDIYMHHHCGKVKQGGFTGMLDWQVVFFFFLKQTWYFLVLFFTPMKCLLLEFAKRFRFVKVSSVLFSHLLSSVSNQTIIIVSS